jgi:hypothetical protein
MSPIELQMADASKRAMDKLKGQGLSINEDYTYDPPSLPMDVTSVDDDELMDMYAKYVAYLEFINLQLWCANTDKSEAEKDMVLVKARKKLAMKAAGTAVALLDAEIEVDEEYRVKANKFQELDNYHSLIQIMSSKLSKDISFINREITRRVNLNKMAGRGPWLTP